MAQNNKTYWQTPEFFGVARHKTQTQNTQAQNTEIPKVGITILVKIDERLNKLSRCYKLRKFDDAPKSKILAVSDSNTIGQDIYRKLP